MNAPVNLEQPSGRPGKNSQITMGGVGGNALRGLMQLVTKRPQWALGAVLLALALSTLYLFTTPPSFRAVSTLEISRDAKEQGPSATGEFRSQIINDIEFYETQYGLLRGPALARDVVRKLKLVDNPKFIAPPPADKPLTAQDRRTREAGAIGKVVGRLEVVPARQSRLVEVRFVDGDPKLAAQIVNAVTDEFIRSSLERRVERTNYARTFLEGKIGETRAKLEEQESRLTDYAARAQIISVPSSGKNDKTDGAAQTAGQSLAGAELQSLTEELARARSARAEAQGKLSSVRGGNARSEILSNNAISGLLQRRSQVMGEIAKLSVSFDDNYPPLMAARSEANQLQTQINQLSNQVTRAIDSDFRAASERERLIQARVDGLKSEMIDLSKASIQYNIIQRDVDTSRLQYESLLQRMKEVSVANDVGSSNVAIVLRAEPPLGKFAPNSRNILTIGLFFGLLLAIATVILLELLDTSFSTPEAVETALDLPLVGAIPGSKSADPTHDLQDPKSPLNEAYVSAVANLRFTTGRGAPQVIAVSSTQPSEGKSTSAIAFATLFSRQGERVVLIDSDMRKPTMHKRLDLRNDKGFANLLAGENDIAAVVQHPASVPNLSVIAAGPHPPSPAELLSDPRLGVVLDMMRATYDRVIIDCPPVLGLADAPLIGQCADGIVFAIEADRTRVGAAKRAIERMQDLRGNIVGVLLTKFDIRRSRFSEYGYDAYNYYSYGKKRAKT